MAALALGLWTVATPSAPLQCTLKPGIRTNGHDIRLSSLHPPSPVLLLALRTFFARTLARIADRAWPLRRGPSDCRSFNTSTAAECCAACTNTYLCTYFTFVHSRQLCWVKADGTGGTSDDKDCTSGCALRRAAQQLASVTRAQPALGPAACDALAPVGDRVRHRAWWRRDQCDSVAVVRFRLALSSIPALLSPLRESPTTATAAVHE
jgi:hypothetical protein